MNTMYEQLKTKRYSAKQMAKPISFFCSAPKAKSVCLSGEFNDWNPASHPMRQREDGWWHLQVPLTHGHHLYHFVVDGKPTLDPRGAGVKRNEHNQVASVMAVS